MQYVNAQSRDKYQLLWRIDGPGIKQSSYLYGSMHLRDSRVFEFSDSVLLAFKNAQHFATEVDMDSLMTYLISPNSPLQDTANYLQSQLSKQEYHYIDSLVLQKAGVHISQMRVKSFWVIEKLLIDQEEALIAEDKNTKRQDIFLDGWFYEKAGMLNKKLFGLEAITNQLDYFKNTLSDVDKEMFLAETGYFNAYPDKMFAPPVADASVPPPVVETLAPSASKLEARYLDSIVNLYYSGDLQQIEEWFSHSMDPKSEEGKFLVKRNQDMTASIIRLAPQGGLFAVVGVGHLTGKNSILQLLRKKGFTVTPVVATFNGVAKKYKEDFDNLPGYTLNRLAEGYSVIMPGTPINYPIPGSNSKMYMSINESTMEGAFAFAIGNLGATDPKTVRLNMIKGMATKAGSDPANLQEIQYMGLAGTQADLSGFGAVYRARVFVRNGRGYLFMHTITPNDSAKALQFFNSVRFNDVAVTTTTYAPLKLDRIGITVNFPQQYHSYNINNALHMDNGGRFEEIYNASDGEKDIVYTLSIQRMVPGYYFTNDTLVINELQKGISQIDSLVQFKEEKITQEHGLKTVSYRLSSTGPYNGSLKLIFRGNTLYGLLAKYKGDKQPPVVREFMENYSISTMPVTALNTTFTAEDSSFTVKGPVNFAPYNATTKESAFYFSYDPTSEASYFIVEKKYGKYVSADPYKLIRQDFVPEADSVNNQILSEKQYKENGHYVYEVAMKPRNTNSIRIFRKLFIAGHHAYMFSALLTEDAIKAGLDKAFFSSVKIDKAHIDTMDIRYDKKAELFHDLTATDSLTVHTAIKSLRSIPMDSTLLRQVYPLIFHGLKLAGDTFKLKYALYECMTAADRFSTHYLPTNLDKAKKTAPGLTASERIAALKHLIKETDVLAFQQDIVKWMSMIDSEEGYQLFMQYAPMLPKDSLGWARTFDYNTPKKLYFEKHLPDLIQAATTSKNMLAYLSVELADSLWNVPHYEKNGLNKLKPGLVKLYEEERAKGKTDDYHRYSQLLRLMFLLSKPTLAEGNIPLLKRMLADTIDMSKQRGALGLINLRQKVADKELKTILANEDGLIFLRALSDSKQLNTVNHLLNGEKIAALLLKEYFKDSDGENELDLELDSLTLVKRKTIDTLDYFIYKYTGRVYNYEEDADTTVMKKKTGYILCGGQPAKGVNWNLDNPKIKTMGANLAIFTDKFLTSFIQEDIAIKEQEGETEIAPSAPTEAPPVIN
ncbi:uncharacterized protein YbaP (TraB family) [Chitinophaga dinghuensis]|uniref:Uncharacterized protein YbaP (TraB family) n=1 Tax=Chitinophaga dinghuensis TaxID=1539050 RepID=A0A327W4D3_9BACT|nr:TraB/GumN family protein [Chitinophaga dinghuensis]RAJ83230.1 uncharacterized protein YbaP (TraB family) [Chitinophaga dinghuensis]